MALEPCGALPCAFGGGSHVLPGGWCHTAGACSDLPGAAPGRLWTRGLFHWEQEPRGSVPHRHTAHGLDLVWFVRIPQSQGVRGQKDGGQGRPHAHKRQFFALFIPICFDRNPI